MTEVTNTPSILPQSEYRPISKMEMLQNSLEFYIPTLPRPDKVKNFDELFFAQLQENIGLPDANQFLDPKRKDPKYGLPCEFRDMGGEFHLFIPRVKSWYYIRSLPNSGNHPLIDETYADQNHIFSSALKDLYGTNARTFVMENKPVFIGEPGKSTPYHRIYFSERGLEIQLQQQPNLVQADKLNKLQRRLSKYMPVIIKIQEETNFNLKNTLESSNVKATTYAKMNYIKDGAFSAILKGDNISFRKLFDSPTQAPSILYGIGHDNYQYSSTNSHKGTIDVFFDINAKQHDHAQIGSIMHRLAELNRNKEDKPLVESWKQVSQQTNETFFRKDLLTDNLPFVFQQEGYNIPVNYRSMIDFETKTVTFEILGDSRQIGYGNETAHKFVTKYAQNLADSLKEPLRTEFYFLEKANLYKNINIDDFTFVGKAIPTIRKKDDNS